MPSNPTLSWERLQDRFYRNFEGYSMLWDINIEDYFVTSAPFGGAIALCRDNSKLTEYRGPESRQTSISLYSGSGNLIHKIPWDSGRITGLGWSDQEHLIVVSEHGNARCYYDFEGNFYQFSLGKLAETSGVKECKFWNTGFVARLANNRFVSVSKYDDPNPRLLAEFANNDERLKSWCLVPPEYALGQHFEVLVATQSSVFILDTNNCRDKGLTDGPFDSMSVSPNGEFISLYSADKSRLWVIGSDFQRQISQVQVDSGDYSKLNQLTWCGNDAVVMAWEEDELTLVGPKGGTLSLLFDGKVVVFPEIDGIRTLTNEKHDFFTRLPDIVVDIFKLGSTSPAAILRDCVEQLDKKSPKADENLMIISDKLVEAVDSCVEAAGFEMEPYWQKKLLRAASFGKSACELYNSDKFVKMCDYLRVLNCVRQFDVGMLIDYPQLLKIGPKKLVERLLIRKMHQMAFQVAQHLRLPVENIYVHWACTKIRISDHDSKDADICKAIVDKLDNITGISYEQIAKTAYTEGRTELAVTLTGYEPRSDKQVPLLLDMQEYNLALEAAVKSYNVNLIVYVLGTLQRKLPLATFFRMINDKPMASKCFERLCTDMDLLEQFYYQDDRRIDSSELLYMQAVKEQNIDGKIDRLEDAQKNFAEIKSKSFEAKMIEEESKLLALQEQLEKDYDQPFVGQTVTDTIATLLRMSQNPRATKIKDEFKVPDKRYWWIRLQVLVARRDWDTLYSFATTGKKSPIGYEPFYNECIKAGSQRNAARYVSMCSNIDYKKKIEMYVEVDDLRQAAMEAQKNKDVGALQGLKESSSNNITTTIRSEIDTMISSLK